MTPFDMTLKQFGGLHERAQMKQSALCREYALLQKEF
jgi:hypothetical protein